MFLTLISYSRRKITRVTTRIETFLQKNAVHKILKTNEIIGKNFQLLGLKAHVLIYRESS